MMQAVSCSGLTVYFDRNSGIRSSGTTVDFRKNKQPEYEEDENGNQKEEASNQDEIDEAKERNKQLARKWEWCKALPPLLAYSPVLC